MYNAMNIALSGMQAAVFRVENSARNIANAQSSNSLKDGKVTNTPYMPQDVIQLADPNGGTYTTSQASDKPPVMATDLTSGEQIQVPNIDLAEELVKVQEASVNYASNLKVIQRNSTILGSLTDIFV